MKRMVRPRRFAVFLVCGALCGCTALGFPHHQASLPSLRLVGQTSVQAEATSQLALEAGRAYLDNGHPGLAVEAYQRALDAGMSPAPALNGLGVAYARLGQVETARRLFEEAIAIAPERADYAANLGRLPVPGAAPEPAPAQARAEAPPLAHALVRQGARLERVSAHELHLVTLAPRDSAVHLGMMPMVTHPAQEARPVVRGGAEGNGPAATLVDPAQQASAPSPAAGKAVWRWWPAVWSENPAAAGRGSVANDAHVIRFVLAPARCGKSAACIDPLDIAHVAVRNDRGFGRAVAVSLR